jgi:hypothetical protein
MIREMRRYYNCGKKAQNVTLKIQNMLGKKTAIYMRKIGTGPLSFPLYKDQLQID